ncbi:DUF6227 family protein [Streptomyces sp. TP-A0874]|uniref:DUF6227 family protein n=1 Tax=Streptomyces sp. TP-A0874 TaxID=549819 RepID=UPI00085326B8|nr:DUF6227 family protein [Streptomyces sp. TP-A0874]
MEHWSESDVGGWPPEGTPDGHPDRLLARVQNPFELSTVVVGRLRTALARHTDLHSCHHSSEAPCPARRSTYRHTYLLPDGSDTALWELVHTIGTGGEVHHEVYLGREAADAAAARLRAPDGLHAFPTPSPHPEQFPGEQFPGEEMLGEPADLTASLGATAPHRLPRAYVPDNSADHARRVLRRAENADRPGERTREILRSALAHEITQVTRRRCRLPDRVAGFSVYEHAFLLLDGGEMSLWEVEHSLSSGGRPVCEVYLSEDAALKAMERRM